MNDAGGGTGQVLDDLRPIREDYAIAPILESFNWEECLGSVEGADWYMVAFRSVRNGDADDRLLYELDAERRCLSFCVWEDRDRAAAAAALPKHRDAIGAAVTMYDSYVLERYRITASGGEVAIVEIEPPQPSEALSDA